jgi:hypothetical protein
MSAPGRSQARIPERAARSAEGISVSQNLPVILIEVVLIFGGVLAFGWWQLRDLKKAREQTQRERRGATEPRMSTEDDDASR